MASSMRIWSDRVLLQQLMTVQLILAMVNGHFTPNGPNDCPPGMPTLPSYSVQQFVSMGPSSPGQYPPSMMGAPSQMMPPSSTMGSPSQSSPSYPQQQQQQPDLAGSNPIGQIGRQVHQFVLESGASGTTMTVANGVVIRGDQAAAASNIVMLPSSTIPGTGGSSMTPGMSPSYLNPSPSMLNRGAAPSSSYSNMIGSPSPIPSNTESSIPMSMVSMSSSPTSGSASTLPVPSFSTSSPSSQSGPGMNFSSPGNTTMSAGANSTTPASKSSIPNWLIDNQWRPSDSDWSSDWPLPGNQTDNGLSSNSSTPPKPESIPIRNDDMFPSDGNQNRSEAGIKNDLKISDLVSSLMNDGSKRSIPYAQASNQTSTANPGSISQMIKQLIPNGNNSTNSPVNASGRDDNVSNDFGANTTNNTLNNSIDQGAGKSSNGSISGLLNWLQDSNNANKPIQNGSKRTVTELVRWLMDEPNSTSSQAEQAANGNGSGSAGSDSIGSSNGNGSVNSGSYNGNGSGNDVGSSSSGSSIPNTIGGNDISNSGSDSSSLSTPTFRPRPDVSGPQSGASSDSSGPRGTISDIIRSLKI